MTPSLLSTPGLLRLSEEMERGAGVDMVPLTEWPPVTLLCDRGLHEVVPGQDCPHCGGEPMCTDCPGRAP